MQLHELDLPKFISHQKMMILSSAQEVTLNSSSEITIVCALHEKKNLRTSALVKSHDRLMWLIHKTSFLDYFKKNAQDAEEKSFSQWGGC